MTFRDEVQEMIADLQKIYDRAGRLRDMCGYKAGEGKAEMNFLRNNMRKLWEPLQRLDDAMPEWLAKSVSKKYSDSEQD